MPPDLSLDDQVAAIVCDAAYGAHADSGVQGEYSQNRAQNVINEHLQLARNQGQHALANRLQNLSVYKSNQDMVAFVDNNNKQVIIGYRGTILSVRDVFNDVGVFHNSMGMRRPWTALQFARGVMHDLGSQYQYTQTGHSLGGSVAEFVSTVTQTKGIGFNPGSGIFNISQTFRSDVGLANVFTAHRIQGDIVSMLPGRETITHSTTHGIGKHRLANFLSTSVGGVDLAGVSTAPNIPSREVEIMLGDIVGATFTAAQGVPMLIGQKSAQSSMLTTQDLAVAIALAKYNADACFSLDPWEPTNPDGPWLRCVYYPETAGVLPFDFTRTSYARTLFEADWLLKQLSMGVDVSKFAAEGPFPTPLPLRTLPAELRNKGMRDEFELKPLGTASRRSRMWITVDRDSTIEGNIRDQSATFSASAPLNNIALQFTDVKLGVQVMRQTQDADGKLVDLVDPRKSDPQADDVLFTKFMTEHYDKIASHYPPLWRLRQLAKLQGIAKWLVRHNVQIDMQAVLLHINQCIGSAPPVTKVPALAREGNRKRIYGGVNLRVRQNPQPPEIPAEATDILTTLVQSTNSKLQPQFAMPFLSKSCCKVCEEELPISSLFRSEDGDSYCPEHHPNACFSCMLPLYVNPTTQKPTNGPYSFTTVADKRYHLQCLVCATCEKPLNKQFKVDPILLHSFYHPDCVCPLENFTLQYPASIFRTKSTQAQAIFEDEEAILQKVLQESMQPHPASPASSTMSRELDFLRKLAQESSEEAVLARILHDSKLENDNLEALHAKEQEALKRAQKAYEEETENELQLALRLSMQQAAHEQATEDFELAQALQLSLAVPPLAKPVNHGRCPVCDGSFPHAVLEEHVNGHFG